MQGIISKIADAFKPEKIEPLPAPGQAKAFVQITPGGMKLIRKEHNRQVRAALKLLNPFDVASAMVAMKNECMVLGCQHYNGRHRGILPNGYYRVAQAVKS